MEQSEFVFMLRMILYTAAALLSLFTLVPVSISLAKHGGYCLLYTTDSAYGSPSACGFVIAATAIFSFIYGGCMAVSAICHTIGVVDRRTDDDYTRWFILYVMLDGITWLFMLAIACVNTIGFSALCDNLFETMDRCSRGYLYQPVFGIDRTFYLRHRMAEVSSWVGWALWMVQFTLGMVTLKQAGLLKCRCPWFCPRPRCLCSCRLVLPKRAQGGRPGMPEGSPSPAGSPYGAQRSPYTLARAPGLQQRYPALGRADEREITL